MKRILFVIGLILSVLVLQPQNFAYAISLSFDAITNNQPGSPEIGEERLYVDVTESSGKALFTFGVNMLGVDPIFIGHVYFDDNNLLGSFSLIDADDGVGGDPGVDFTPNATPSKLPSQNTAAPPFETTTGLSADADDLGSNKSGVDAGETLGILFDLQGGKTFQNVLTDLGSGDLRIGIHAMGIGQPLNSESFVNKKPGDPIPEPSTVLLLGIGLLGIVGLGRRKLRK